jgi:hypothetical protein
MKNFSLVGKEFSLIAELLGLWLVVMVQLSLAQSHLFQGVNLQSSDQIAAKNHKCSLLTILEASRPQNIKQYQELQLFKLSPSAYDSVYYSPSGHFKIYYSIEGFSAIPLYDRNQNNIQDYLEFVGKSFDRAWSIEIDSLGFKPPPDSSGQPRNVYPVFCRRISDYGIIWLDYEIPQLPGENYVTYIEINTNFNNIVEYPGISDPIIRDSMAIAVTAAHDFNHALQCGYRLWPENNTFPDFWFIESSATYMEEVVAEEVNDYLQYLEDYFQQTSLPLDYSTGTTTDYGKVAFLIMLGKLYGSQITREIWAEINWQSALPALEKILCMKNTDLMEEIRRMSVWLYFTGNRSIGNNYFPDAELFPSVDFITGSPIQSEETILISDSLPRISFQWYLSYSEATVLPRLLLKAGQNSRADELFVTYLDPISREYYQYPASLACKLPFTIGTAGMPYNVVNTAGRGEAYFDFQLIARPVTAATAPAVLVYPQPLELSARQPFLNFSNLPVEAEISIFTVNGKFLITLKVRDNVNYLNWDLRLREGEQIGSGVYIYRIKSNRGEEQGKFLIVK